VLIRLITKGDQGLNHLAALRRLATGHVAFRGENHIVPMLREIALDDMVFAVFPLMHEGFESPWHYNYGEVVDAVYQMIEVSVTPWLRSPSYLKDSNHSTGSYFLPRAFGGTSCELPMSIQCMD
jgi:hypothetical protein